jgi:hypothetical protein
MLPIPVKINTGRMNSFLGASNAEKAPIPRQSHWRDPEIKSWD